MPPGTQDTALAVIFTTNRVVEITEKTRLRPHEACLYLQAKHGIVRAPWNAVALQVRASRAAVPAGRR